MARADAAQAQRALRSDFDYVRQRVASDADAAARVAGVEQQLSRAQAALAGLESQKQHRGHVVGAMLSDVSGGGARAIAAAHVPEASATGAAKPPDAARANVNTALQGAARPADSARERLVVALKIRGVG
jgi:hypothetical protein